MDTPLLTAGASYTWDELGPLFGFRPAYFSAAGGMPVSTKMDSVLLITHPGGGKSFDYADYWDGEDLIYTGRGQVGDQRREGPNRDVADNRRRIFVFEAAEPRVLRYLGKATCIGETTGRAPDRNGALRNVLQFRLRFADPTTHEHATPAEVPEAKKMPAPPAPPTDGRGRLPPPRRERAFDPDTRPSTAAHAPAGGGDPATTHALREQARQDHHDLVAAWALWLESHGWSDIREVPGGFDLLASTPAGQRVLFEMKTISNSNELKQTRTALAQLLEYRVTLGRTDDQLCLVVDGRLTDERANVLDALSIACIHLEAGAWLGTNTRGEALLAAMGRPPGPEAQFEAAQRRLASTQAILRERSSSDPPVSGGPRSTADDTRQKN